jgi:hypothetical protein
MPPRVKSSPFSTSGCTWVLCWLVRHTALFFFPSYSPTSGQESTLQSWLRAKVRRQWEVPKTDPAGRKKRPKVIETVTKLKITRQQRTGTLLSGSFSITWRCLCHNMIMRGEEEEILKKYFHQSNKLFPILSWSLFQTCICVNSRKKARKSISVFERNINKLPCVVTESTDDTRLSNMGVCWLLGFQLPEYLHSVYCESNRMQRSLYLFNCLQMCKRQRRNRGFMQKNCLPMFLSCDYSFYNQQKFYFLCLFNQLAVMKLSYSEMALSSREINPKIIQMN